MGSGVGLALAISIPILVFCLVFLVFWFQYLKHRMAHEREMLALQKGLTPPAEPGRSGRASGSVFLLWMALAAPVVIALIGLFVTVLVWSDSWTYVGRKWDLTGIAWVVAGWASTVVVSTSAVVVAVRNLAGGGQAPERPAPTAGGVDALKPEDHFVRKQE